MSHIISNVAEALKVETAGLIDRSERREILVEIVEAARRTGAESIFIDHRKAEIQTSVTDAYDFGVGLLGCGLARSTRIAVLPPKSPQIADIVGFAITVAQNRGVLIRAYPCPDIPCKSDAELCAPWPVPPMAPCRQTDRSDGSLDC